ncbi:MAG: divalent-cation tolerance protein CutA [Planctomycetota bacterium]|jgi:periplasmic divalent cation tolerance protein|nr:divalent-cation tolerance protein CutA [Planctomycetota bacterium]
MSEYRLLYVTCGSLEEAEHIGRHLVTERLAACANMLPAMRSIYRWQGAITSDEEVVLLMKTRAELVDQATEAIVAEHGYEVPCVVALPIVAGHSPFLGWISAETTDASD